MSELSKIFMLCESCQDENEMAKLDRNRYKANIKYDGERIMAHKNFDSVVLFNRRGNIVSFKFPEIVESLKTIEGDFLIDGEIISNDCNFNSLQRRALTKDKVKISSLMKEIPVKYMVFDILAKGKERLMDKPLRERLDVLNLLMSKRQEEFVGLVCYDDIDNLLAIAIEMNGEGIVIKDMDGIYEGRRSRNWLKHKLFKETTITITGYEENNAGIRATDNNNNVVQIAGYNADEVKAIMQQKGYCEVYVQYLSMSKEGRMRFPSYRGIVDGK